MSDILIIGGSGFLSGTLARRAVDQGHRVWTVTRGQRPVPDGVIAITTDRRDDDAFRKAISEIDRQWDFVVDSICYDPEHARQDISVFR